MMFATIASISKAIGELDRRSDIAEQSATDWKFKEINSCMQSDRSDLMLAVVAMIILL
jgi:hypothetical protein